VSVYAFVSVVLSILFVLLLSGVVSLLAGSDAPGFGNGIGAAAKFNLPFGLLSTRTGSHVFVADPYNNRIRLIKPSTQEVITLAGTGEPSHKDGPKASECSIFEPRFMAFDRTAAVPESVLYIACEGSLRRLNLLTGWCNRRTFQPVCSADYVRCE
jgi:hypothetical protein